MVVFPGPELLDAPGIARATVESLAENTSDAAIASLFWAGVAGAPGVVAHRCINTLDAMVGYRNDRYREFGWAPARMDDYAAWLPARLTALLHTGLAGLRGRGRRRSGPGGRIHHSIPVRMRGRWRPPPRRHSG